MPARNVSDSAALEARHAPPEQMESTFPIKVNQDLDKLLILAMHTFKKTSGSIVSPLKNDSLQLADRNTELADVILGFEPEWREACVKGAFNDLVVQQGN